MRIAFYVSGHGYGHATRDCQIIKALLDQDPQTSIVISSRASPHIFKEVLDNDRVAHRYKDIDPAVVQPVAYAVDAEKTTAYLEEFIGRLDTTVEEEKKWLLEEGIELILADAPFMPCYAASLLALPTIVVTNFTFAEVYSYFPDPGNTLQKLVEKVIFCYRHADIWLRMPGYMPNPGFEEVDLPSTKWIVDSSLSKPLLEAMDRRKISSTDRIFPSMSIGIPKLRRRIIDTPLSVRLATPSIHRDRQKRSEFLMSVGLPEAEISKPILLVAFGGHPIFAKNEVEKKTSELLPPGWIAIMCGMADDDPARSRLPEDFYAAPREVHVPDLLVCATVVLGKLGYGMVSEAISTNTPMIYVPRTAFIEEFGLKRMIETFPGYGRRQVRGREIPPNVISLSSTDFENGQWRTAIELVAKKMQEQGLGMAEPGSPIEDGGPQYVGSSARVDGGEFIAAQVQSIYQECQQLKTTQGEA